jgi:hypothetical protein
MTATPQQYMATFELTNDGQAVLDDLVQTFGGPLWHASADERARRIGWREVVEHIHARINQANPPGRRAHE